MYKTAALLRYKLSLLILTYTYNTLLSSFTLHVVNADVERCLEKYFRKLFLTDISFGLFTSSPEFMRELSNERFLSRRQTKEQDMLKWKTLRLEAITVQKLSLFCFVENPV